MKQLRIDFARASLRRTLFHTGPAGWALSVLALLLCLGAALQGWQLQGRQRADQAALAAAELRARVRAAAAPAPVRAARISEAQAGAVNRIVLQLNLPWRDLHDAIAAATPASIALLALEPDARRRRMKISAEARTSEAMLAYVEQLKRQPLFADVALRRHEINEQDPNRPIRFQLDAQWVAQ